MKPIQSANYCSEFAQISTSKAFLGNFFQSRWFETVLRQIGWKTVTLKVQSTGCEAAVLAFAAQNGLIRCNLAPCYRVLFGPTVRVLEDGGISETLDTLFERLHAKLRDEGAVFVSVRTPFPFPRNWKAFCTNGYTYDTGAKGECSVIIDIRPDLDRLWKGVKRFARRNIKKASEMGVEVRGISNEAELREFYRIYMDTCSRRSFDAEPYRFYETFWRELEPRGKVKFFLAWWKNRPIAGILNTFHGEVCVPYIACSLDEYWSLHPNHLLFWHSIEWSKEVAKSSVFKLYHLPRTRERVNGVDYYTFKTCFGGTVIEECSFYEKILSPIRLRVSQVFHKQLSRVCELTIPTRVQATTGQRSF